jgi:hypothetical protein
MMQVNDRVAFSKQWLRSTGQYAGDIAHARGEIIELITLGHGTVLAVVAWNKSDIPAKVNTKNLITVKQIPYEI